MMNETISIMLNTTAMQAAPGDSNWMMISSMISAAFMLIIFAPSIIEATQSMMARLLLAQLAKKTRRSMISIVHGSTGIFGGMITQATLTAFQKELTRMRGKPFDLLLHTPGGDVFSSMMISRLIKEYPGKIRAIIPSYAMSGGTLLALSCDEIIMSPCATLGMTDPQLGAFWNSGSAKSWSRVIKLKGKKADDASIRYDLMGEQCTSMIKEHLLSLNKYAPSFIDELTNGERLHSYQLTRSDLEARGIRSGIVTGRFMKQLTRIISYQNKEVTAWT